MPNRMFDRDPVDRETEKQARRNRFVENINEMYHLFEGGDEHRAKDWALAHNCLEHYNALAVVYGRELVTTATMHNTWPPRIMDGLEGGLVAKIQEYHLDKIQTMISEGRVKDALAYSSQIYGFDILAIRGHIKARHWGVVAKFQENDKWDEAQTYIERNNLDNGGEEGYDLKQALVLGWVQQGLLHKARNLIDSEKLGTDFLTDGEKNALYPDHIDQYGVKNMKWGAPKVSNIGDPVPVGDGNDEDDPDGLREQVKELISNGLYGDAWRVICQNEMELDFLDEATCRLVYPRTWTVNLELERINNFSRFKDIPESDNINHPSHYTRFVGIEVIDLTEQLNFNLGNAVKYVCRAGHKDPSKEIEDLEKAVWYINREIERINKRS